MSVSQLPASPQPHSLSETASNLVCHIHQLLRRLRDLEDEEAKLNAQARQLVFPTNDDRPSTPIVFTPVSKLHVQATENVVNRSTPSTPPHIDPRNIETPMKAFMLMELFTLAMSVKSKRKARIFLGGDSTEFGERK